MKDRSLLRQLRWGSQRGQAIIFVTLSIPILFGLMGLVVDFGWAYWRREAAKTAAAAAASGVVAAAGTNTPTAQSSTACPTGTAIDTTKAWNVGCDFATQNGFTNGVSNRTVSIAIGSGSTGMPVSGVSPSKYWVSATVTEKIPTLFSWVLGHSAMNIAARSTVAVYNGGGGGCIYALNPTMDGGINMSNGSLTSNCGIYVKSNNAKAIDTSNGSITTTGGAQTYVVGTCNNGSSCSEVSPTPGHELWVHHYGPLRRPGGSLYTGLTTYGAVNVNGGTTTIYPGIYTGLITANNGTLLITPGTYILQAGFDINGATVRETAATGGELFYITGGQLDITSGTVTLNAQTSGTYKKSFSPACQQHQRRYHDRRQLDRDGRHLRQDSPASRSRTALSRTLRSWWTTSRSPTGPMAPALTAAPILSSTLLTVTS